MRLFIPCYEGSPTKRRSCPVTAGKRFHAVPPCFRRAPERRILHRYREFIRFFPSDANISYDACFNESKKKEILQISPEECDHPVVGVLCKVLTDETAV